MSAIERVWYGEGPGERVARALLAPPSWMYRAASALRNALYDRGVLRAHAPALPALSIGNLSVGGTGKTPVAAWAAAKLKAAGAHPAMLLRGYGDDEPLVHAKLNADVPVVTNPDRVAAARRARTLGADCVILDDGFQHRRIRRHADWVLVAAEQWRDDLRSLPAGPLRETEAALRRADVLVITRKSAPREVADEIAAALAPRLRDPAAIAVCHLAPYAVVDAMTGHREPLSWLTGRDVSAVAAIGTPSAFFSQLAGQGASLDPYPYADHHAFDARDVARIIRSAERRAGVVCTLKDAVKLVPLWPPSAPPLWYVSQRAVIERGGAALDASLGVILAARVAAPPTAGPAGPSSSPHGHRSSTAD
jgi:tetraacyldisaccharide 4'-kinase